MPLDPRRIEVIDDRTAAAYKRMTPSQRVEAANTMFRQCVEMVECGLRSMHPQKDDGWVRAEVLRRVRHGSL